MENMHILPEYNLILIRYGEIWLKSQKVKMRMLKILINNIKKMLKKENISFLKYQISKDSSRIFFFFKNEVIPKALEVLSNVFGIYSLSPCLRTSNKLEHISQRAIEIGNYILKEKDSFAIRVKRSGRHDYSSIEVAKDIGKAVLDNFSSLDLKVNLTSPKKVIFIEIRDEFSYLFSEIVKSNWGGLPIEKQKKVAVMDIGRLPDLISGFLLMKRGCLVYPVLFEMTQKREIFNIWLSNWKEIANYIPFSPFTLRRVNLLNILKIAFKKIKNEKYICGICRLIRFDVLSRLIRTMGTNTDIKIRGITDGVSLNKSTLCPDHVDLDSIALNYLFSEYPIFTPIIGLDLGEIDEIKGKISKDLKEFDYCELKPKEQEFELKVLENLYASLELTDIIQQAVQNVEEIRII
ncbi:MAG: THUMP domain-containing protein [Candidatus Hermodarchaeota archaeon]